MTDFKYDHLFDGTGQNQTPKESFDYRPSLQQALDAIRFEYASGSPTDQALGEFGKRTKEAYEKGKLDGEDAAKGFRPRYKSEYFPSEEELRINDKLQAIEKEQKEEAEAEQSISSTKQSQKIKRWMVGAYMLDGIQYVVSNDGKLYFENLEKKHGWVEIPSIDFYALPQDGE